MCLGEQDEERVHEEVDLPRDHEEPIPVACRGAPRHRQDVDSDERNASSKAKRCGPRPERPRLKECPETASIRGSSRSKTAVTSRPSMAHGFPAAAAAWKFLTM